MYFVTYSVVRWLPIFENEQAIRIVTDSITFCHFNKGLRINAYVIMPTHMHAIVFDQNFDCDKLSSSLAELRRFTGRKLSDFCSNRMPARFADELSAAAPADRERRFWQPSRHPEAIVSQDFWRIKIDYIHENPVRKALVSQPQDWPYSSAGDYLVEGERSGVIPVSAIDR